MQIPHNQYCSTFQTVIKKNVCRNLNCFPADIVKNIINLKNYLIITFFTIRWLSHLTSTI